MATTAWIDLTGHTALVTGAASGIGRAAARALGSVGATVLACDLNAAGAAATAAAIEKDGGRAHALAFDVTTSAGWTEAERKLESLGGKLDVLVNSAGVIFRDSVGSADVDVYRRTFAVNVEGALLGMKLALQFMRRTGTGSIVNVSSTASLGGGQFIASYAASKSAIASFTRSAAQEAVRSGYDIRINSIHPGLIETDMAERVYEVLAHTGTPDQLRTRLTTGRTGKPEEVADLIVFLASSRASYISGAGILIDRASKA